MAFIWVLLYLLPKARKEHDAFAIVCSILSALAAFAGWLLIGTTAR